MQLSLFFIDLLPFHFRCPFLYFSLKTIHLPTDLFDQLFIAAVMKDILQVCQILRINSSMDLNVPVFKVIVVHLVDLSELIDIAGQDSEQQKRENEKCNDNFGRFQVDDMVVPDQPFFFLSVYG